MAVPEDILTAADLTYTGLPVDRLAAIIQDAFATADAVTGYRLSLPTFDRIPQLRAVMRRAIEYYAEAVKRDPTNVTAGPMSVSYAQVRMASTFYTADQVAELRALTTPPRVMARSIRMGLPCS